jgi:hypothetical protein
MTSFLLFMVNASVYIQNDYTTQDITYPCAWYNPSVETERV